VSSETKKKVPSEIEKKVPSAIEKKVLAICNGYDDTFRINILPITENSDADSKQEGKVPAVYAESFMSMVKKHPLLSVTGVVEDPKCHKRFKSFGDFDENAFKMQYNVTIDSSILRYSKEPEVQACTNFTAYDVVEGKSVCTMDVHEMTKKIDLSDIGKIVKNITVDAPKPKAESDTFIRVVYNGRTDNEAAYNFAKANSKDEGGVRYVNAYYPFSVRVELDDHFEFVPDKPVNFDYNLNISMNSNVVMGGEVHFNTAYWRNLVYSIQGNELTFGLPYNGGTTANYWGVDMPLTAKQAEGYFDFHLNFDINYRLKGTTEFEQICIIVSSEDLHSSDDFVKIKQSKILWGCLGKDTFIRTEGGYKKIDEIEVGEKLFTDKGYVKLRNMVTGTEEKIIAVGVSEDKTLLITKEHPIATDRGVIRAYDLAATDKLKLEDGTLKDIYYLEVKDYGDKVYSPELEESALISADGIMVGDYLTHVDVPDEPVESLEPLDPELLEELKKWTALKNEQI
jgi:hypothetical protein